MSEESSSAFNDVVDVNVFSFAQLLELEYPLALDNYQRAYVWGREKTEQLVQDLYEYEQLACLSSVPDYYMGTLLLHNDDDKKQLFVIDGQQRLTSLGVLFYTLQSALPAKLNFNFRSALSVQNIQQAKAVYEELRDKLPTVEIFQRLRFTVITVKREDLAFTFFDTQNNRGVPLAATDLLKAFHLRAIHSGSVEQNEQMQEHCARRWESLQVKVQGNASSQTNDFAPNLFNFYLWRARNWKGQRVIERETRDDVLATFQKQSIPVSSEEVANVPLYLVMNNRLADSISLLPSNEFKLNLRSLEMRSSPAMLPFSLRQPIHQGVGFFLYAQKYADLLNHLLYGQNICAEVKAYRHFYKNVMMKTSHYLREVFNLAVLIHIDQFGYSGLLRFALWLDHVLGAIRLEKAYIFKQAPLKYLKESTHNLLDIITGAYRTQEVIDFLAADAASKYYLSLTDEKVVALKGVRGDYLEAVQAYYGRSSLASKQSWITDAFLEEKLNEK
jgi:hypothetical protein